MAEHLGFRAQQAHATSYIAPGAIVTGDVSLEAGASVWFQAVLRGDCAPIRVGRDSNVQDGCVLHADPGFPCTIGQGVTVGHLAIVHGATVGNNVIVGMRSIVQNGATVGDDCIVAAGSVVLEGMEIPSGMLVMGMPARIKRPLRPEEIAHNRAAAEHYAENAKAFAAAHPPQLIGRGE